MQEAFTPVIMYEAQNNRIAVYVSDEGMVFVTNTFTGKAILCSGFDQALDLFDHCIEVGFGNKLIN